MLHLPHGEWDGSGSDACLRDAAARRQFALGKDSFWPGYGAGPARPVLLFGLVEPEVRRVELRFQDGTHATTRPHEKLRPPLGARAAAPRREAPGGRCASRRRGSDVRHIAFDPTTRDIYPCERPTDPGLGPPACP